MNVRLPKLLSLGGRLMLLVGLLLGLMVFSLGVGAVSIAPGEVLKVLLDQQDSATHPAATTIIWDFRLQRVILAVLVGLGLGTAGAGYQGLFRNPLADPFVIGASSGAALGATLAMTCGLTAIWFGMSLVALLALGGALAAVAVVYAIASWGNQLPAVGLLLAGAAVGSFVGALVALLMFMNDDQVINILSWLMGSLAARGWSAVWSTGPMIVIAAAMLWALSRPLDALTFGEETAASLGVRMSRLRAAVVLAASLATAAAVAAGGIIGFVGLIAPHAARMLVGPRHVVLIPASGLLGAILLLLADDLARTVAAPGELPVGILTALLGGPFFLYLLRTRSSRLGGG